MAISDAGAHGETTGNSLFTPSSTLRQRNLVTTKGEEKSAPPPTEEPHFRTRNRIPQKSSNASVISTSFMIIIAIVLGIIVLVNVTVTARVLFAIFKKSNAASRNRPPRRGSIEIGGDVRLEEITTINGKNVQVYKGKRFSSVPNITSSNGGLLIVEPRAHSLLPLVCSEFDKKVPSDWVLYIVHSYANAAYARKSVENIPRKKVFMQLSAKSLTVDEYNSIFKNPNFWEFVKTEHILVFQTDSTPCGPMLDMDRYGQFGYVGCAYYDKVGPNTGYWDEGWSFYGSGGLSLRRKSFTLACLEWYILNDKEPHEYEDVSFSHCVDLLYNQLQYRKPTLDDVGDFCAQNSWGDVTREPRSFGAHQHGIQMQDRKLKRRFLAYCPMAALI